MDGNSQPADLGLPDDAELLVNMDLRTANRGAAASFFDCTVLTSPRYVTALTAESSRWRQHRGGEKCPHIMGLMTLSYFHEKSSDSWSRRQGLP
jgi:hypothetical protein